jgi:hypothetical protein
MDNIFEILIYLFIIISIFSPLFKKKEKQPPVPPQRRRQPEPEHIPTARTSVDNNEDSYDILKEIETFFKTEAPQPQPEFKTKQSSIEKAEEFKKQNPKERLIKSESTRAEQEIKPVVSEHTYGDWNKSIIVDDSITRKAEHFAEMMKKRSRQPGNEHIIRLREKLKNPQTLKDYIIFAEILGKPKALRR